MNDFLTSITQKSNNPIWPFFSTICSIPHPSKHELALINYIIEWATQKGLEVSQDYTGNILIRKPATKGCENKKGVVLQAHLDMVPQKNEGIEHDFILDPIKPYIDGEWVTATDTTLGADNGIGMASCLAVLDSSDIQHGPLEVLLTVDEEMGMTGAFGLEANWLTGDILLNTDSEQEGEVYMGCAGGVDATLSFELDFEPAPIGYITKKIEIKGLKGGHSGVDINTGRANANKLLARFLATYSSELQLRLTSLGGGTLRNAIPREANAIITLPEQNLKLFNQAIDRFTQTIQSELSRIETQLNVKTYDHPSVEKVFTLTTQNTVTNTLNSLPNGVMRMSDDIEGVVETSINVGVVNTDKDKLTILCLIRSLIDSGREQLEGVLQSIALLSSAELTLSGTYPGWKPDPESQVMALFREMYQNIYGHKPNVMVIHAGLECGLFKKPYPEMDMLSFGPTIKFPHSPDEKVHIESVDLYWQQMKGILEAIPER